MKKLAVSFLAVGLLLSASVASADDTSTSTAPGAVTLKTITVYGRADKPHVEIILTRATAASAAGAAHDGLHSRLMAASEPRPMSR